MYLETRERAQMLSPNQTDEWRPQEYPVLCAFATLNTEWLETEWLSLSRGQPFVDSSPLMSLATVHLLTWAAPPPRVLPPHPN